MKTTVLLDNQVVAIEIIRKPIKHTYLRCKGPASLQITTGRAFDGKTVQEFASLHERRIRKLLAQAAKPPVLKDDEALVFGRIVPIASLQAQTRKAHFTGEVLTLSGANPEARLAALECFYREATIAAAIEELADLERILGHRIDLSRLVIKSSRMKTRLGSCIPGKRTIKLNSLLGRFERKYLRMILLHELVHLKVSGHQRDFYDILLAYVPNYRREKRELATKIREYGV